MEKLERKGKWVQRGFVRENSDVWKTESTNCCWTFSSRFTRIEENSSKLYNRSLYFPRNRPFFRPVHRSRMSSGWAFAPTFFFISTTKVLCRIKLGTQLWNLIKKMWCRRRESNPSPSVFVRRKEVISYQDDLIRQKWYDNCFLNYYENFNQIPLRNDY